MSLPNDIKFLLTPRTTPYFDHMPSPKQAAFLCLPHREAFYGGAAGGGKSDALLMAALQYVDRPGYAALIVMRTFKRLEQENAILDRAKKWLLGGKSDAKYNAEKHKFMFPAGSSLSFGHMENEDNKYDYQTSEYHYIAFDELTQFTKTQYLYLAFSRARKLTTMDIPIRVQSASNPGGEGHEWVKERFEIGIPQERRKHPERIFIRAMAKDNPALDVADYMDSLGELDTVTKRHLMLGDWTAHTTGNMFNRAWLKIIDRGGRPPSWRRTRRFWDLAASE